MMNLKVSLFNYTKGLDYDTQEDIVKIIESHYNTLDFVSEKQAIISLNEKLEPHSYDKSVRSFLENLNQDLKDNELLYSLKDLYKVLEQKNQGSIYRHTLVTVLDIINAENDSERMGKILTELASQHDWINEVKVFIHNLSKSPQQRTNLLSGGKVSDVYTIVESVEGGHIALIGDSWFFLSEKNIEKTILENHVTDQEKVNTLRLLQEALKYSHLDEKMISFKIDENITVGLSIEKPGETYLNENKLEKETTLETLFSSAIIPLIKKDFYRVLETVSKNIDSFVDLDVVKHVSNIGMPYLETYIFNFGENVFLYRMDRRFANSFYKYESATDLINDIKNDMQTDVSFFFENRLDDETKQFRALEDKVREVRFNLDEIDTNIDKVQANIAVIGESVELKKALSLLERKKIDFLKEEQAVRGLLNDMREKSNV